MDASAISEGDELYWDNPEGTVTGVTVQEEYNGHNVLVYYESEAHEDGREVRVNPDQLYEENPSE